MLDVKMISYCWIKFYFVFTTKQTGRFFVAYFHKRKLAITSLFKIPNCSLIWADLAAKAKMAAQPLFALFVDLRFASFPIIRAFIYSLSLMQCMASLMFL